MGNPLAPQSAQTPYASTQTTTPSPAAFADYQNIINRAQGVASLPYTAYSGELAAPTNAEQQQGIAGINANANWGMPYIQQAAGMAQQGASPLTASDIQTYQNPYTTNVVQALQSQFNNQNAQGLNQLRGNAASQGALGGDRVGVAEANYLSQQNLNQNPIIANLISQGYTQATATAEAQKQAQAQGAYALGNLGNLGQTLALQGAGAQFGVGSQQQSTQQLLDQLQLQQFQQQQAFPYQQAQWLAGITGAIAPQFGGTTTGSGYNTQLGPSIGGQVAGLGMAGLGLLGATGGFGGPNGSPGWISNAFSSPTGGASGGRVNGFDDGGGVPGIPRVPYGGVGAPYGSTGYIPGVNLNIAPPQRPGMNIPGQQGNSGPGASFTGNSIADNALKIAGMYKNMTGGTTGTTAGEAAPFGGAAPEEVVGGEAAPFGGAAPEGAGMFSGIGDALSSAGSGVADFFGGIGSGIGSMFAGDAAAEAAPALLALAKRGGRIRGFAEGGPPMQAGFDGSMVPSFDDRYSAADSYPQWLPQSMYDRPMDNPDFSPSQNDIYAPDIKIQDPSERPQWDPEQERALASVSGFAPDEGLPENAMAYAGPSSRVGERTNGLGQHVEKPDPWMALMAAGLGTAASQNHWGVLGQLGEGGLHGMQQYSADAQRIAQNRRIDLEAQRLQNQVQQHRETLTQQKELHDVPAGYRRGDEGLEAIPGGPADPSVLAKQAKAKLAVNLSDRALDIGARQMADGDLTPLTNVGRGAQGGATIAELRNRMYDVLVNERGMNPEQAASFVSMQTQAFKARQLALNADARTTATREANLNMIIKVADSAVPAALEQSDAVYRTGFVPLNKIIQGGRIMTSDPEQRKFGIANIQLAEGWARAMNPTGQMRESDRDIALSFLSTADSKEAYRAAVLQVQKQIHRERDAISSTTPGGWQPGATVAPTTESPKTQIGTQDQAAMDWLTKNPNHPDAAGVRDRLKAKGLIQ